MDRAFDCSHLNNVARRQSESIVLDATKLMYIYKMRVMTEILISQHQVLEKEPLKFEMMGHPVIPLGRHLKFAN